MVGKDSGSSTRDKLVRLLQRRGEISVAEAAEALGVSSVAARQHLRSLEADGLAGHRRERKEAGRPVHLYSLTDDAHKTLPNGYHSLCVDMITQMREMLSPEQLERILAKRSNRLVEKHGGPASSRLPLLSRVRRLAGIQDEEGYLPNVVERDGGVEMVQCHCMLRDAAQELPVICETERRFFGLMSRARVTQIRSRRNGDRACSWFFSEAEEELPEGYDASLIDDCGC